MELSTKIFGWILLIAGVIIIGWTLYSSYNIFTGKTNIPEIFSLSKESNQKPAEGIEAQMREMMGEQLKAILPVDTFPKLLNLLVWAILAGILTLGGAQISSLGIKLIKK